jgi:hypothetical protein
MQGFCVAQVADHGGVANGGAGAPVPDCVNLGRVL